MALQTIKTPLKIHFHTPCPLIIELFQYIWSFSVSHQHNKLQTANSVSFERLASDSTKWKDEYFIMKNDARI